jgi:methylisocitrate lyase
VKVPILANITEFGKTPLFTSTSCAAPARHVASIPLSGVPRHEPGALERVRASRKDGTRRRRRHDADPRRPLQVPRLPRLRAKLDALFAKSKSERQ